MDGSSREGGLGDEERQGDFVDTSNQPPPAADTEGPPDFLDENATEQPGTFAGEEQPPPPPPPARVGDAPDFLDSEGTNNIPAEQPAEEAYIPSDDVEAGDAAQEMDFTIDGEGDEDKPEERDMDDDVEEIPFGEEGEFEKEDEDDMEVFEDEEESDEEDGQDVPLAGGDGTTTKRRKRRVIKNWRKTTKKEKEPSKAEKRRRRRACCILFCCCILILILILLLLFLVFKKDEEPDPVFDDDDEVGFVDDFFGFGDSLVPDNVQTTPFDPYVKGDCDFSDNFQPHVISQCECDGKVSIVADDIRELYGLLREKLMPELYSPEMGEWNEPITSCSARNQALLWLSSGDTRRAGDLVQRFLSVTAYVAMNGTKWDYQNLWLSDQNECLWLGLQCNSRFQIHSLALDTINIFGKVRCMLFVRFWLCVFLASFYINTLLTGCTLYLH